MTTPQKQQITIVDQVRKMEPEFKLALPAHIPSEKFTRIAVTAINGNPDLLRDDVDKRSVLRAVTLAAQDGLVIDNREAALVIFNTKEGSNWVKKAQYMPMVAGVMKKMRNSGEIANISTGVVYREEWKQGKFEYIKGDSESLRHEPILFDEKGDMIGCYAVVTLKDGSKVRAFMDIGQIEKIRKVSKSGSISENDLKYNASANIGDPKGIWKDWYEEMATKSVLRKVAKLCPQSSDIDNVFKDLDEDHETETFDVDTSEVKTPVKKVTRASQAVLKQAEEIKEAEIIDHDDTDHSENNDEDLPI